MFHFLKNFILSLETYKLVPLKPRSILWFKKLVKELHWLPRWSNSFIVPKSKHSYWTLRTRFYSKQLFNFWNVFVQSCMLGTLFLYNSYHNERHQVLGPLLHIKQCCKAMHDKTQNLSQIEHIFSTWCWFLFCNSNIIAVICVFSNLHHSSNSIR